jgi:mono/diheme cytochrome c family protein
MKSIGVIVALALALIAVLKLGAPPEEVAPPSAASEDAVDRGRYLVRAGNCFSCHTARGGEPYAGGRPVPTPFGTLYSSNITPDPETGIGRWSAEDLWRALHEGKSPDGSLLYPAFPYTHYTKLRRSDSDAMFAYLRTVADARHANRPHEMRFPYDKRPLLAGWRALYFDRGTYKENPKQTQQWNRGAYLVEGLGHCSACHATRSAWGGVQRQDIGGGLIPVLNWYAPSLASDRETGLGAWEVAEIVELLKTGVAPRGAVFGPMAEVVRDSLQHLTEEDLVAMAVYLKSQRDDEDPDAKGGALVSREQRAQMMKQGARLYGEHCAACHHASGEGVPRIYPPLAGNQAILMRNPVNAIRITLNGGFPPSTQGNPRPYGMPPFAHQLGDREVAAVLTYIRGAWGNRAAPVSPAEVADGRGVPLD